MKNLHFQVLFIDGVFSMGPQAGRKVLTACAARSKQYQPGKRMIVAPANLERLEDSRCMGAAFRLGWR